MPKMTTPLSTEGESTDASSSPSPDEKRQQILYFIFGWMTPFLICQRLIGEMGGYPTVLLQGWEKLLKKQAATMANELKNGYVEFSYTPAPDQGPNIVSRRMEQKDLDSFNPTKGAYLEGLDDDPEMLDAIWSDVTNMNEMINQFATIIKRLYKFIMKHQSDEDLEDEDLADQDLDEQELDDENSTVEPTQDEEAQSSYSTGTKEDE